MKIDLGGLFKECMTSIDYVLKCAKCTKVMGCLTLFYIGVPHNTGTSAVICIDCLPKQLEDLKQSGFDPKRIAAVEKEIK